MCNNDRVIPCCGVRKIMRTQIESWNEMKFLRVATIIWIGIVTKNTRSEIIDKQSNISMNTLLLSLSVWLVSFSSHVYYPSRFCNGIMITFGHALSSSRSSRRGTNTNTPTRRGHFLTMDSGEESLFLRPPISTSRVQKNVLQTSNSFLSWNH